MTSASSARVAASSMAAMVMLALAACNSNTATTTATEAAPQSPRTGGVVALTGARLIDGTGAAPVENATLVISGGKVQAAGAGVQVPDGAQRIDVSGKTIIPGLISAHTHFVIQKTDNPEFAKTWFDEHQNDPIEKQFYDLARLNAEYGVTTMWALGEQPNRGFMSDVEREALKKFRDAQWVEGLDRARVYYAMMPATDGGFGDPSRPANTGEEARANVKRAVALDADIIKLTLSPAIKPEVYIAAVDEAHKNNLKIVSHLAHLDVAKGVIKAGGDGLAHSVRDQDVDAELIAMMKKNNAFQIPTLTQEQSNFMWAGTPAFIHDPFFLKHAAVHKRKLEVLQTAASMEGWAKNPGTANSRAGLAQAMRNVKILSDAGIPIVMGTDSGGRMDAGRFPGFMEHEEMDLYFQSGLTPMQIIQSATGVSAKALGIDQDLGTLQPGRWADLVVLDANPLENFRNIRKINAVWIAGHPIDGDN